MNELMIQVTEISLPDINTKEIVPFLGDMEDLHRVEFINWKGYTICNVLLNHEWRTCSFPKTTTVGEFLLSGQLAYAKNWRKARLYKHEL